MQAFQKYCQFHQKKMFFFTIFAGIATLLVLILVPLKLVGNVEFAQQILEQGFLKQLVFGLPITFVILLFIHRIFKLFIDNQLFSRSALICIQSLAKVTLAYSLLIQPGLCMLLFELTNSASSAQMFEQLGPVYFANVNFALAAMGYAMFLIAGTNKVSRDLETDSELTI